MPLHRSLRRRSVFAFFTEFEEHCLTEGGQAVAPEAPEVLAMQIIEESAFQSVNSHLL